MMSLGGTTLLLFLIWGDCFANGQSSGSFVYTIYTAKKIRPGFDIAFSASVRNSDNPVVLISSFRSSDNQVLFQDTTTIQNGPAAQISLGRLPLGYSGSKSFILRVAGLDAGTGATLFNETTNNFEFAAKSFSIMIQTDKAIYQPGQKIKFRALCFLPDLRPLEGSVTYKVETPNDNIVLLETNVSLKSGVAGGEIQLTRKVPEGQWKVIYEHEGYTETLQVTVQRYKLPRFEVSIDTPGYIHARSPGFTITLKATYTFGQPVSGIAAVRFQLKTNFNYGFNSQSNNLVKRIYNFDGDESVFVTEDEIRNAIGWNGESSADIEVYAEVLETLTETKFNKTANIKARNSKIKVEVLQKPEIAKPGLLYQALVRVTEQDGTLLSSLDRQNNNLIVTVRYRTSFFRPQPISIFSPRLPGNRPIKESSEGTEKAFVYPIPPDGLVRVDIEVPSSNFETANFRAYTNTTSEDPQRISWKADKAFSPSNSFIQITAAGSAARNGLGVGDTAEVTIRTTQIVSSVRILIIARGQILSDEDFAIVNSASKQTTYSFSVTSEMTPSVLVLASFMGPGNEVVADYVRLNVEVKLENQMTIMTSNSSVDAGTYLVIRVNTSSPKSYVGIRAVDQSVLLLKSGNDISKQRVVEELGEYSDDNNFSGGGKIRRAFSFYFPRPSGARDARSVFNQADLTILTNSLLYSEPRPVPIFLPSILSFQSFGGPASARGESARAPPPSNPPSGARVRNLFPETWIWNEGTTGENGSVFFHVQAPDTITSWIISAFAMSNTTGLGIADNYKLTVFRNFFVTLNLPLKITRGEIIIVQAVVFNYFDTEKRIVVRLTLSSDQNVTLLQPGGATHLNGDFRVLPVPAKGSVSVKFPVRIDELGEVPIQVLAFSTVVSLSDAVERRVFVKPEGVKQCYSASSLVDISRSGGESNSGASFEESLIIRIPTGIVPGSASVTLHAYGNILGSTMSNLGRLLRAPGGCGEQNMISFAPDVFVTLYLRRVQQLTPEIRKKAYQHISDGYMNELSYKRDDGSFSAFGSKDETGSTWLTAFVVKTFLFARELQSNLVEEKVLIQAVDFLVSRQNRTGSFEELGRVIHTDMQGGVNSPTTMTAYVLIALSETNFASDNLEWGISLRTATQYLEMNLNSTLNDSYALSIVTYALTLRNSSLAGYALSALNSRATTEGSYKYWHVGSSTPSSFSSRWRPPYVQTPTNNIEMTSYALLTYVRRNDVASALPVLKWLVSKQNDLGGYSSTQDTVLAIQALSEVAAQLTGGDQNLTLTFRHSSLQNYIEQVTIRRENANVFNTFSVPGQNGQLIVRGEGSGIGVAQLSVCYNTPSDPFDDEPFNCTVDVQSPNNDQVDLEFCCSQNNGMEPTGMFLFEIGLLNGFSAEESQTNFYNPRSKLVEVDDGRVNIYFDQLFPTERLCAKVELKRVEEVAATKPAVISAFDYYKPDRKVTRLYTADGLSETGVCQVCGSSCVGCQAARLSDWSSWAPCTEYCKPQQVTRKQVCFDPNLNRGVSVYNCKTDKNTVESRACVTPFSCPDTSDGLWFDTPSTFDSFRAFHSCSARRLFSTRQRYRFQRISRSPKVGIPGQILNGNREFVQCSTTLSFQIVSKNTPFTISYLIRPNSYDSRAIFLSIGRNSQRPVVMLEKTGESEMQLTIEAELKRITISSIPIFPIGQWSHLIVTWNAGEGAAVYINGTLSGVTGRSVEIIGEREVVHGLYIGRSSNLDDIGGFLNATVSSLNVWSSVLDSAAITGLYEFNRELLRYPERREVLTVRQLRSFPWSGFRSCIKFPTTLSSLYSNPPPCSRPDFSPRPVPLL